MIRINILSGLTLFYKDLLESSYTLDLTNNHFNLIYHIYKITGCIV